ncbi:hypothetical protein PCL_08689 [Purpureocillium lilacinum]|uniref:Zn(2)-C6 fungal-type domain-containing protein n=1 Tax=Purpureocillium lilacinum TaxID=33203 RepID=A0A2U3DR00_PURLI|nr:hypothetical protein PCL_08689 [Purpureocillium lilacinum]
MQRRYKQILPVSGNVKSVPVIPAAPSEPAKRKRSATSVACNTCRVKKTACDGSRPACTACLGRATACIYISVTPDETPAMAMKREIESLREMQGRLMELLDILKTTPESKAVAILQMMRLSTAEPASLLLSLNEATFNDALPRQVLAWPPTQGSVEFELMIRHAFAYPALTPLDSAAVGMSSLLSSGLANSVASALSSSSAVASSSTSGTKPQTTTAALSPQSDPAASTVYCDSRLALLDISCWTALAITNELAAALLSLYLETDHPTLGFFDADLFLTDLIERRVRYCSPLLVSAVLSWACPGAAFLGDAFFKEAHSLWHREQAIDSLPTIAAAQLLSLGSIYNGYDGGFPYLTIGTQMAQRMGLFGLPQNMSTPTVHGKAPEHWTRASSHTAWGTFNWINMRSFMFHEEEPAAKYPPNADPPGAAPRPYFDDLDRVAAPVHKLPHYMGQTFPVMCEFWLLTSEWTTVYYVADGTPVVDRVPLGFAQEAFQKLLTWSDNLATLMARGDQSSHHGIIFHIWFHASILQLFRPFTQPQNGSFITQTASNEARSDTAKVIFAASLNQLKHLAIVFRYTHPCASYAILWHVALLHVANAVMQDTKDPQWRAYFMLCMNSYADLCGAFRVVEGIVTSLLSIALRLRITNASEARALVARVHAKGGHDTDTQRITASFVIDLDLAVTDRQGAQLESLYQSFDDLTLFQEFTEVECEKLARLASLATHTLRHLDVSSDSSLALYILSFANLMNSIIKQSLGVSTNFRPQCVWLDCYCHGGLAARSDEQHVGARVTVLISKEPSPVFAQSFSIAAEAPWQRRGETIYQRHVSRGQNMPLAIGILYLCRLRQASETRQAEARLPEAIATDIAAGSMSDTPRSCPAFSDILPVGGSCAAYSTKLNPTGFVLHPPAALSATSTRHAARRAFQVENYGEPEASNAREIPCWTMPNSVRKRWMTWRAFLPAAISLASQPPQVQRTTPIWSPVDLPGPALTNTPLAAYLSLTVRPGTPALLPSPVSSADSRSSRPRLRVPPRDWLPDRAAERQHEQTMERKRSHETETSEAMGNSPISSHGTPSGDHHDQPPQTSPSQRTSTPDHATAERSAPPAETPKTPTTARAAPKALPNPRDHTTDQLNQTGDEFLPREVDHFGEKKVMANGQLLGGRRYWCRAFLVANRGDKLFMLATECAKMLGYRDSYLLFNKNRSLYKIVASQAEKDDLVQRKILPFSFRSRQIAIVTARSMFRQFGSRVIEDGRRVRDDYWETLARKQGFTEADPAGEKRPGSKSRAMAESTNKHLPSPPRTEVALNTATETPSQPDAPRSKLAGTTAAPPKNTAAMPGEAAAWTYSSGAYPRDWSSTVNGTSSRQITGPRYQNPAVEVISTTHEARAQPPDLVGVSGYSSCQRGKPYDHMQTDWPRRPEQPSSPGTNEQQPAGSGDRSATAYRPHISAYTAASIAATEPLVPPPHPPQALRKNPYPQSLQSHYYSLQLHYYTNQPMWSQTLGHSTGTYATQYESVHRAQSPAFHVQQPRAGQDEPIMSPGRQYGSGYGMYLVNQTPRGHTPHTGPG